MVLLFTVASITHPLVVTHRKARTVMFLSRRVATMEVEFVSIERVMEYTRLPREAPPELDGDGHPVARGPAGHAAAVLAEELYLRYEVPERGERWRKQLEVSHILICLGLCLMDTTVDLIWR